MLQKINNKFFNILEKAKPEFVLKIIEKLLKREKAQKMTDLKQEK